MKLFKRSKGVMGINARNLLFISKYNSRANKKFADDKIYTKNYLQSRGLNVAKLYSVVKKHSELHNFDPKSLPDSFVVKPNRGFGGEGIIVIEKRRKNKYVDTNNVEYNWSDLYTHCESILSGKYAISGIRDQIIFEEFLQRSDFLSKYSSIGLPDIRIIVFNLVPVMAMLRLPTEESKGKGNLHMGAIGLGIDMQSGRCTFGVSQKNIYKNEIVRRLPSGDKVSSLQIPNWDEVLFMAAKAQQVSNIGYLAADIALTTTGVKIIELNARAGLSVQIANNTPLRTRIDKIADLVVSTPEQGVEICKTLFSKTGLKKEKKKTEARPVIGLFEEIELLNINNKKVWAKIDPHAPKNILNSTIKPKEELKALNIKIANKRLTIPFVQGKIEDKKFNIIISGKYLTDFLIDTNPKNLSKNTQTKESTTDEKIIKNVDRKICEIDKEINILSYLKPLNLESEKQTFFEHPGYNPKFIYKKLTIDTKQLKKDLKKIPTNFSHPLQKLYLNKIKETEFKLNLLESMDTPGLQEYSEKIYGKVDKNLYHKAVDYYRKHPITKDETSKISFGAGIKIIEKFLHENKLKNWKIKIVEGVNTDIQVNKSGVIFLKKDTAFTEDKIAGQIAHEIQTHIFRNENGKLQKMKIFERGTAGYLKTEEGLAIFNKNYITSGDRSGWAALNVIALYLSKEMTFSEVYYHLIDKYFIDPEIAWKFSVKTKRGYSDTSKKLIFAKDHIYFAGKMLVENYVDRYGIEKLADLYIGKISINDLKSLGNIKEYSTKYIPNFYKK